MAKPLQLKKQIYRKMYLLTTVGVVLTTLLLSVSFYSFFDKQMRTEVRTRSTFFTKSLNYSADNIDYIQSLNLSADDSRLSIVAPDGTVLYDSYEDAEELANHLDRPEIVSALKTGYGEAKRFSDTLNLETFYCATKLSDDTVLRLAQTTKSIYSVFFQVFPLIGVIAIFIAIIGYMLAKALTKRIVEPINNIDLDSGECICYDELAPFVRTIFEQKELIKAQLDELQTQVTTINSITKSMNEGLILLDAKENIISINESAFYIFDVVARDLTQKNIVEFTRNADILESINEVSNCKNINKIIEINKKFYAVIGSPVYTSNTFTGIIIILLDVTQKQNAEKLRREFSANVSHELKTPLTTISGFAELINAGMAHGDDVVAFSGKIRDESTRLLALIEDIIRLSELDEMPHKSSFEEFDLLKLAKRIGENLTPMANERNVKLSFTGEHFLINANQRMINELLQNLMDNSIKYNKDNGKVVVDVKKHIHNIIITVSDSGIGIPINYQSRVFERFFRVDKSRSKKTGGTGLGLAIVKHIAQFHNGGIVLESRVGIGTTITVTLPIV